MIDKIVDKIIEQMNSLLGPSSSAETKLGLVTNVSLKDTHPNKTLSVVEGQMQPREYEIGVLQPTVWQYEPIELQLLCKGTEKEAKETRRTLISLIRQAIYSDATRLALTSLTNTVGSETERVLKYNLIRIRTDVGELKGQFYFIAVFQLSVETEISIA